jgi:CheY-like chemotaxis protein
MLDRETRYLKEKLASSTGTFMPVRATGPLNEPLPWVIEFRVVGSAALIQVQVDDNMLIGRADPAKGVQPAVDLSPHGGQTRGVSRQHAIILVKDNRIYIKDLYSVNGTRVNGFLLDPEKEYRLRHSDNLEIGMMRLQVRFTVLPTLGSSPAPTNGEPAQSSLPRIGDGEHVVIVEDDPYVAKVFGIALRHAGFKVTSVDTAAAAIALFAHEFPQLVLLDLMLPDMNGLDLLRYIRRQPGAEKTEVLICSGSTGGFHRQQALDAGAKLFIGKPISVENLLEAVRTTLGKSAVPVTP